MILKLIAGPLIGMIIGYFTNWLAVKMLFRPRRAKYIAGRRLPFTPGVIPRGKERIAESMRDIINDQLLTEEAVKQHLASEEIAGSIRRAVRASVKDLFSDSRTWKQYLSGVAGEERFERISRQSEDLLTEKIFHKIQDMHPGKIAADMVSEKIDAALADSFLGKMFGGSVTANLSQAVEKTVNDYVRENGREIIHNLILEEKEKLLNKTISESAAALEQAGISIETRILKFYTEFAVEKSGALLRRLNIGSIAEQAIRDMNSEQLELLVFSSMKTELKSVVNLGALIGFLLGLFNLLIYAV